MYNLFNAYYIMFRSYNPRWRKSLVVWIGHHSHTMQSVTRVHWYKSYPEIKLNMTPNLWMHYLRFSERICPLKTHQMQICICKKYFYMQSNIFMFHCPKLNLTDRPYSAAGTGSWTCNLHTSKHFIRAQQGDIGSQCVTPRAKLSISM